MSEPEQKPGRSKQDYGTPWEFIRAVERRWGKIHVALAAHSGNAKAEHYIDKATNSLSVDWGAEYGSRICWLNPEFADIGTWAAHCAKHAPRLRADGGRIIMLTPASIGTGWFADHVNGKALVLGVGPRLTFEGTTPNPKTGKPDPYPKDLMLSVFGEAPGFDVWRWSDIEPVVTTGELAARGTLGANIVTRGRGR